MWRFQRQMNNLFLTSFFYSKTDPGEIDAVHIVLGHKIIKGRKRFSKKGKKRPRTCEKWQGKLGPGPAHDSRPIDIDYRGIIPRDTWQ